jgi:hypothetical protein
MTDVKERAKSEDLEFLHELACEARKLLHPEQVEQKKCKET